MGPFDEKCLDAWKRRLGAIQSVDGNPAICTDAAVDTDPHIFRDAPHSVVEQIGANCDVGRIVTYPGSKDALIKVYAIHSSPYVDAFPLVIPGILNFGELLPIDRRALRFDVVDPLVVGPGCLPA